MSTIADLWKSYLIGEGYAFSSVPDTIRQALLSETDRSTGSIQELWKAYLEAEGYDGAVPDMMKKWLAGKGYDGSVQDMLKKALVDGDIFAAPAPACSISLTGDTAVGAGYNPMTISGQTASYTLESPANVWLANQPAQRSKPATGTILVEVKISGTGSGAPSATIADAAFTNRVLVGRDRTTGDIIIAVVEAGSPTFADTLSPTSKYALGVNSAGDVLIYVDGVSVDLGGAGAGMFSATDFALAAIDLDMQTSGTGSVQFITAGANFEATYIGTGLRDWCDTDTVNTFTPDSIVPDGGNIFMSSVFTADPVMYEDVALEDAALVAGDPIGGIKNLSQTGTLTLSQPNTVDKFAVHDLAGVLRARKPNGSSDKLISDGTFNMADGMVLAMSMYISGTMSCTPFGGNGNHLRVERTSAGNLEVRAGGSTTNTLSGILTGSDTEYRIILAFGGGTCDVYVDGAFAGTFSTQSTTTVFDAVVVGNTSLTGAETNQLYMEDIVMANTDGRITATQAALLNAYMDGIRV